MANPKTVLLVRFKPRLSYDEVVKVAEARADDFRALPGLVQKYYLHDAASGEVAGLYLWEGPESLAEFRDSELRRTIAEAYRVDGEPRIEVYDVIMPLRVAVPA